MANVNAPMGFRPVKLFNGGIPQRSETYTIASGYGTSLFTGDLVKSSGTGKGIITAATTDTFVGVFAGCQYIQTDGSTIFRPYWPASTSVLTGSTVLAYVYDNPDTLYEVQFNGALAAADIGALTDPASGSGNTSNGISAWQASTSNIGNTGLKIYELVNRPDNAYGTNAKALVLINRHEMRPGTLTGV